MIEKALTEEITAEQLAKIGCYTRREVEEKDLFVFSVILCDNEVDRDFERFTESALAILAELFLGKTGIFDHMAKAENQSARIFDTKVMVDTDKTNSLGQPYQYLKAWAYMVRCEKNTDLILEIDAGIKKEISIGCAVEKVVCSVCGSDKKEQACPHEKGKEYGGVGCHYLLENPTDAYEWSFVAIPAQKNAGVTKGYGEIPTNFTVVEKIISAMGEVALSKAEVLRFQAETKQLKELAQAGREYIETLRQEIVRSGAVAQPELDSSVLEEVSKSMTIAQLQEFKKAFVVGATKKRPARPQLMPDTHIGSAYVGEEFKI